MPLIGSDWLDDHGHFEEAHLLRSLATAWPARQVVDVPSNWDKSLRALPAAWHSVFAIGCSLRTALWLPGKRNLDESARTLSLLALPLFSAASRRQADADWNLDAWSSSSSWSRTAAAWSRAYASRCRAYSAMSRASALKCRSYAATSRSVAARDRSFNLGSPYESAVIRAYIGNLAYDSRIRAEGRWQAGWLASIRDLLGQ